MPAAERLITAPEGLTLTLSDRKETDLVEQTPHEVWGSKIENIMRPGGTRSQFPKLLFAYYINLIDEFYYADKRGDFYGF